MKKLQYFHTFALVLLGAGAPLLVRPVFHRCPDSTRAVFIEHIQPPGPELGPFQLCPVVRADEDLTAFSPEYTILSISLTDALVRPPVLDPRVPPNLFGGFTGDLTARLDQSDSTRIVQAVANSTLTNEAPVIELLDQTNCPILAVSFTRNPNSPVAGYDAITILYQSDQILEGVITSSSTPLAVVRVSGACSAQNQRLALAASNEWLTIKHEKHECLERSSADLP